MQSVLTPIFDRYGISRAVLFVSVAKGTATAKSDLDLLVDSKLRGLKVDVFNLSQLGELCRVADDAFTKAHPEIP